MNWGPSFFLGKRFCADPLPLVWYFFNMPVYIFFGLIWCK